MLLQEFCVSWQAVQAAQVTFEDYFMSDLNIAPLKIVGYEGVFGFIFMAAFMLPIVQHLPGTDGDGFHEDSFDTWHVSCLSVALMGVLMDCCASAALLISAFLESCLQDLKAVMSAGTSLIELPAWTHLWTVQQATLSTESTRSVPMA